MEPDELIVRAAAGDDAAFIVALRTDPATAFLAVSDQSEADVRAELTAAAEHSGRLLAECDAKPLAALKWTVVNRRSRIVALSEVMVRADARGRGIAAALARAASRWLVDEHAAHRVQLEVYGENQPATCLRARRIPARRRPAPRILAPGGVAGRRALRPARGRAMSLPAVVAAPRGAAGQRRVALSCGSALSAGPGFAGASLGLERRL
jgi:GNAT superfamily N-acetyltransferase